ncbi:MAG: SdpI family protein [Candidatus Woesearchaeota archaeon]
MQETIGKNTGFSFSSGKMDKKEYILLAIIVLMFAVASFTYNAVPEKIPSHWNKSGEIDGYSSRIVGLFLLPVIALCFYILISAIPYIAVYRKNILSFYSYIFLFKLVFIVFIFVLHIAVIIFALGFRFKFNYIIVPMLSLLLFTAGVIMKKSKRNYFIGVRTPWTLSSDKVWDKTNRIGGIGFQLISLLLLFGVFFPENYIFFIFVPLFCFSIFLVIFSYKEYAKEKKNRNL